MIPNGNNGNNIYRDDVLITRMVSKTIKTPQR